MMSVCVGYNAHMPEQPLLPLRYRLIVFAILFLIALYSISVMDSHVMQQTAERRRTASPAPASPLPSDQR